MEGSDGSQGKLCGGHHADGTTILSPAIKRKAERERLKAEGKENGIEVEVNQARLVGPRPFLSRNSRVKPLIINATLV